MVYINLCLYVYSWWLVKMNMCVLLRAVACTLFSSNGMHAVINHYFYCYSPNCSFFIIINIKQVIILQSSVRKKIHDIRKLE